MMHKTGECESYKGDKLKVVLRKCSHFEL